VADGIGSILAFGMVKDFSQFIIGKDPMKVEAIWKDFLKLLSGDKAAALSSFPA